jgi:probable HAF family extracellular repeat protein
MEDTLMTKYRSIHRTVLLSALVAMLLGGTASPAFAASLTPLGDLPGGPFDSLATGVSADGSVVVGFSRSASDNQAFRWTAASGMVGLGGLKYDGSGQSYASGVSADGSVVVVGGITAGGSEAFRWTAASGMVNLGNFSGNLTYNSGTSAANGDGSVVVGSGTFLSGGTAYTEAFRWTAASGLVGLGDLPGGNFGSGAIDVSADGSTIVGNSYSGNGISEAFRWTAASGMVGLGDLPGGDFYSQANGVSADGSTVVGYSRVPVIGNYDLEAFRWTAASGMVGLGDLPGGDFYSTAWDVSADGSTVVGEGNSDSGQKAVRWTSAGGIESLWDVLLANGIDPAADGWTQLIRASGVSANGNTIVGNGIRNGNLEAFVAVVPEPGGLSLIGLAAPALLRRRQRVNHASVK